MNAATSVRLVPLTSSRRGPGSRGVKDTGVDGALHVNPRLSPDEIPAFAGMTGLHSVSAAVRTLHASAIYPSTTLRVVPLPIVPMGRNCQDASL